MSGLSLAVGPYGERKMEQHPGGLLSSVRTIELQLVAFIVVFSASGLVPLSDIVFPVFVSSYLWILSKFVFPTYSKEGARMEVFHGSRNFQFYLSLGTVLGLFLPLAYVLGGFARGDRDAVKACTPHLFLLSAQILSENLVSNLGIWSPPVRAFLAAIYNGRRIFSLAHWVDVQYNRRHVHPEAFFNDHVWLWFGRSLAVANLIYFNINMFCFIIPRFIPRAFQRYNEAKANVASASTSDTSHIQRDMPKTETEKKSD
ncbi:hypothetical protein KP509_31G034700 [Ceratopteris richardii]|uniref:DUF7733 domain-containing protein n=1 Tax=Ceratopteris richardii TaxID=49495 RepID=A0A8T2QX94_CERRI|nr:hypothetical protein KP509_31G034700 [Ceratopteris richardii]KAH7288634.1 hypothetical protein KP509_31G034700 [Ceratopteris richardii]KAH7288635.1 hypothetical protein KP509_31G034700 [Ceratopteris richardii]KAH7288636.1 hypothetical protein KP509_31G034700 [Ceratopteris richardii]